MKRTNVKTTHLIEQNLSSEPSMDCSCEILYDTSLSNIGDSDCDCSECLEANLNAFNDLKNAEEAQAKTTKKIGHNSRGRSAVNKKENNRQRENSRQGFRSTERKGFEQKGRWKMNGKSLREWEENDEKVEQHQWDGERVQIDEFLMVTRNRTRKYIEERNKLKQGEEEEKERLKQKIKQNLEILRCNAIVNQNTQPRELEHPHKWNHSKYACQCNGPTTEEQKHKCCYQKKEKAKLNTGMEELDKDFISKRDEVLKERRQKRLAKLNQPQGACPHDHCPNHHNRTDENKIKKIQKFIQKQALKYEKSKQEQKKKQEEDRKIKEAKLRAIDIKCREKVQKSKKVSDVASSRSTFRLSIDQFDTFSEMRQENERKKKSKQVQREVKKNLREGGGALQNAIYEDLEEEEDLPRPGANIVLKKTTKGQIQEFKPKKEYSQRILHDAKISEPKHLKMREEKKEKKQVKGEEKKKTNLSKGKEQAQRKKLQEEIERKKKEIVQQYSKRNTTKEPANRKLGEEYERQGAKKTQTKQTQKPQTAKDPYRKNYRHQAGVDPNQINAHGDPLLQEYVYHDGQRVKAAASLKDNEIFTQNINSLTGKNQLRL